MARRVPQARVIALLLAGAGAAGCHGKDDRKDPCAYETPGAAWLAFQSGEAGTWDIHVIRADGTCRRALTSDAAFDANPVWAPGGVVVFESDRPTTSLWRVSAVSGALARVDLPAGLMAASPAISPDGTELAFEGRYAGSTVNSIFVVPLAGGTPVDVTPEAVPHGNGKPVFSPDGQSLYFVSNRAGPADVFRVPVTGSLDPEKVTTGSRIYGRVAVSPDGATLAYTRAISGTPPYEVALFDPAHGTSVALGVPSAAEPTFDPAGGRLAVRTDHDVPPLGSTTLLELVPLPAAGSLRLTTGRGPDGAPAFDRLQH